MIINSKRMIYYGACEVRWSPYSLTENEIQGISTRTYKKRPEDCQENNMDS
jgi:hypothetical protein